MHRLPKTEVVPQNPLNLLNFIVSCTFESGAEKGPLFFEGLALQPASSGLNWFKARPRQGVPFTA